MAKKICNAVFVGGILLVMVLGLLQTVLRPKEIESYENRYANKLAAFSLSAFLDGSWQEQADLALADQVTFAPVCKKVFNRVSSYYLWTALRPVLAESGGRYVSFPPYRIFGDGYVTYYPRSLDTMTEALDTKTANYNEIFAAHPDTAFYLYFIEKDTDIDFETGERTMAWEYMRDRLDLPAERMAALEIDSFEDFSSCFYKTDHHWCPEGSLRGYREVMALLGTEDPLLEPLERVEIGTFSGSKGAGSGLTVLREPFYAYRYAFPDMTIAVNGAPAEDYGSQSYYLDGGRGPVSYSTFYGGDMGEIVFDTGRPDRENILILGESYDNAILKLVASHYNKTWSVDLRYYQPYMGEEFRLADYLEEHQISKVLLIGNIDCFILPDFLLED